MIDVVTKHNALLYPSAIVEMFRLRHRIFVERMGWEALRKADGIERDEFDTDDAIYLILQEDDGTVIGCHRLLPTLKPHLFSHIFPEFCDVKGVQIGPHIYEVNRTCADEERLSKARLSRARADIMVGLMEFAVTTGIEHITVLSTLEIMHRCLSLGWNIRPLGVPRDVDGVRQGGFILKADQASLDAAREAYGVDKSLIQYIGPQPKGMRIIEHITPDAPTTPVN